MLRVRPDAPWIAWELEMQIRKGSLLAAEYARTGFERAMSPGLTTRLRCTKGGY